MFAVPLFMFLNDLKVSNYFGFDSPILTHKTFCIISGIVTLVANLWILLKIQEKKVKRTKVTKNIWSTCSNMKNFFANKVLRNFSYYLLTQKIGFAAFQYLFVNLILVSAKITQVEAAAYCFPIFGLMTVVYWQGRKLIKTGKEMT